MAEQTLFIEVVTPRASVIADDFAAISLPGAVGDLQVFPNHRPLLTALRPGRMACHTRGGADEYYLAGGFAEVLPTRVVVLADECIPVDEIDLKAAKKARKQAQKMLDENRDKSVETLEPHFVRLRRANAQIDLVEGR
jgi:F-type H+-transporting ATPase subunit epsilon